MTEIHPRARLAPLDEPVPTVLASAAGWSGISPEPIDRLGRSRRSRSLLEASRGTVPPYAVPTMVEIEAGELNGLTVASTFAGAGGSSTGWRIAGYRVVWANEFHPPAAESYAANYPATILDRRDIRIVTGAEIVAACGGVPDVLDGSPPCQDFSMAGKRSRGWGESRSHGDGTTQRSDDLFAHYIRLVGEIRPRAFVAENVKGLVSGVAKGQFKRIHAGLVAQGYRVRAKVLDAQWLGVPQRRKRVIFIGIRDDLGADPVFPDPLPYRYSMLDACPWLADFDSLRGGYGFAGAEEAQPIDAPAPTIGATAEGTGRWEISSRIEYEAGKRNWSGRQLSVDEPMDPITVEGAGGLERSEITLAHYGGSGRVQVDEPLDHVAPTITNRPRSMRLQETESDTEWRKIHGTQSLEVDDGPAWTIAAAGINGLSINQVKLTDGVQRRRLEIAEIKRLCSFPDDYVLTGSYNDQWARLGNSVPPLMMAAVGRKLASVLM